MCYKAGLRVLEWEDMFFVAFESDVCGSKCIQCWRASLQDGHMNRVCFLSLFLFLDCGRLGRMRDAKVVVEVSVKVAVKVV